MRLLICFPILLILCGGCDRAEPSAEDRLAHAAEFLWSQQSDDGGWHSATHGLLQGGQAWTPFVLHALLQVPESIFPPPEGGVQRGLEFIRSRINGDGALGLSDPVVLEYPNYSTAYALLVVSEHGAPEDSALVAKMSKYLVAQQFVESRGISRDNLAYGAWGFGETNLSNGQLGHVDLSHSRRALQALRYAGLADSSVYGDALIFLRFLQKAPDDARPQPPGGASPDAGLYDGGFYASSVSHGVNKGRTPESYAGGPTYFGSYASATADGVLALLAAGLDRENRAVQDAAAWLRANPDWEVQAGIPLDDPARWDRVMFFYHLAVRAEVYAELDEPGPWRDTLLRAISTHQHADGRFANPDGAPNKEDDPILATAMMVETLCRILQQ